MSVERQDPSWIAPVVRALCGCLLAPGAEGDPRSEAVVGRTADLLLRRIQSMPRFLGVGIAILTLAFDWWGVLRKGRRFRKQDLESQRSQLEQWERSFLGPCRDLIEFYALLVRFIYYSQPEPLAALGASEESH